ncbi:Aurora kinase 2 splicing [Ophiocordyceps camponoti-floridani]|uniref:Aurora kinase 2 splicing n=1 Tax=Ophiocordyceps camponoti-floridani TaxID=2030778 RepID=A0A8H4Q9W9_9HYPO|nr:Aurora kinase 2 splicing [Ophiocordyceps camponoti-floridani]
MGFVIVLAEDDASEDENGHAFVMTSNILHWASTKSKRVTRSVLASEIYALVARYDSAFVLSDALRIVFARLGLLAPPVVVCTDSYSLYECLVKMGTTTEKRLMIDLAALR